MILGKYQICRKKEERGYSITAVVQDEFENNYFAKWIKGIEQNSQASKILFDKLRNLKKATHKNLAKIIEYDWDENEQAYCIIFQFIEARTLENEVFSLKPTIFLKGIENSVACLKELNQIYRITHGDINPANILIDENEDFFLIDFGIADIATTLSQEKELEIFARDFAAPEKWNRKVSKGFPHQSDIFSIGKIMEWYFEKNEFTEFSSINELINKCCEIAPDHRINYSNLKEDIASILFSSSFEKDNRIDVKGEYTNDIIKELNDDNDQKWIPKINVLPKGQNSNKENYLLDVYTKNYYLHCLWLVFEKQLVIRNYSKKESIEESKITAEKYAQNIGVPIKFDSRSYTTFNLTPTLKKNTKRKRKGR